MQQGGNPGDRAEMKEPSAPREVEESICWGQIWHGPFVAVGHVRDGARAQGSASECCPQLGNQESRRKL